MINRLINKDNFWVTLIIIVFSILYITTIAQVNVGYSDSDQFLAVAYQNGVAHPPGYPLYMLILSLWIKLPIAGSIAFKGHLLSTIFSITTLVLIYKAIRHLLKYFDTSNLLNKSTAHKVTSFISVVAIGITQLFWLYGTITEVFALHVLLTTALIYRSLISIIYKPTSLRFWIVNAVLLGLSLSHHHTIVLISPLLLLAVILNFKQIKFRYWVQLILISFLTISFSYLILFFQNTQNAFFSWNFDPTFSGFLRHVVRSEFSGVIPETGQVINGYLPQINMEAIFKFLPKYLTEIANQFGYFVIITSLFGFYVMARKNIPLFIVYLTTVLITGPFFAGILGWPNHFGSQANAQRLLLMGYVFWPLTFSLGLNFIINRLQLGLQVLNVQVYKTAIVIFSIIIISQTITIYFQYPLSNLRNFRFVSQTYSKILDQVKPNSLVTCFTDTSCFALMYEQSVNRRRPDVIILPRAYPLVAKQLAAQPDLRNFLYADDPFRTFDYITWSIDKRPVYAVEISEYYYHLLGINEGFTYYVPYGIYGELVRTQPSEFPDSDFNLSESVMATPIPSSDRMRLYFLSNVIRTYQFNSVIYLRAGYRDQSRQELNVAGSLNDYLQLQEPIETNFDQVRSSIESGHPDSRFAATQKPIVLDEFLKLIDQWKDKRRLDVAHKLAVGSMTVYPDQVKARLAAAQTFKEINQIPSAIIEYRNVLVLDPQNEIAVQALEELQSFSPNQSSPSIVL